ncbi:FecR family protein [Neolewinella aurantiaca]|uniref:FecR family protein n=1 Tax=Neolewinella aurantiaca TaxID=2602767 RepID=UPI00164F44E1|nr:FecR domain-containing protein [Neolewinella aurantiaca]
MLRLKGRIEAKAVPQPSVRRLFRPSVLSAAAAVLLLFTVGTLLLVGNGKTTVENFTDEPFAYTLPDGTEVLLQQGSELTFGADYNETDRLIALEGQAYFEVVKDASRPFLVNTSETELRVTGTAFNLRISDEEELEVEVSEGEVELHQHGKVYPVPANYRGLAFPGKSCVVKAAKDLNRHAWRTGILRFEGVSLADVITTVSNNYGLSVSYPQGCDFPVSGTFSSENPISVLQTIAELGQCSLEARDEIMGDYAIVGLCE